MKHISHSYLFLILAFAIAGCNLSNPNTWTNQVTPSPTSTSTILPSQTATPRATLLPTLTKTLISTLEPREIEEIITRLLQEPVDCAAPCFWGIVPGQTKLEEANDIFIHFGLPIFSTTNDGKKFSSASYEFDSGLSILATLRTQDNNIVNNIQLKITPNIKSIVTQQEWNAYSPETLIERYGPPNYVGIAADWGPGPLFCLIMYFDAVDLIVEYSGDSIIPADRGVSQICPLTARFDSVWLWLGKNPEYPPGLGVPLEDVTSLTVDEFSQLMVGDPDKACFMFDGTAYKMER